MKTCSPRLAFREAEAQEYFFPACERARSRFKGEMTMKVSSPLALLMLSAISMSVSAATFDVSTPAEFQSALTAAASNGVDDTINVAAGTYNVLGGGTLTYTAAASEVSSLSILGAGSNVVFLDGSGQVPILRIDMTNVTAGDVGGVTVTNMTFSNGNAAGTQSDADGGALYVAMNTGMIVMVTGSEFYNNAADDDGGAIFIRGNVLEGIYLGDLTIDGNTARGIANDGTGDGGGAHIAGGFGTVVEIIDIFFWDNIAQGHGGGLEVEGLLPGDPCRFVNIYDVDFDNNQISGTGSGGGAAILAMDLSIDTTGFYDNVATVLGGGLHLRGNTGLYMKNGGFLGNIAPDGGGLGTDTAFDSEIVMEHNTIIGNSATSEGGGIYMSRGGSTLVVSFYNNIIWDNLAETGADLFVDDDPAGMGGIDVATVQLFNNIYSDFTTSCTIDAGCTPDIQLADNLNQDPLLELSGKLTMASPAIDAGLNGGHPNYPTIVVDFEGDTRPFNGIVDIGADEYTGAVAQSADLAISKADDPDPVTGGLDLTYTISVSNNGPGDATGVMLTDTFPGNVNLTFVSATPTQGSCTGDSSSVSCALDGIANGATASVSIVVTTPEVGVATPISNSASVMATESDDNPSNNTITEATTIVPIVPAQADLALVKTGAPDPVFSGGPTLSYDITLTNNGPDGATGIVLVDTLPDGVTLDDFTPPAGGSCSAAFPTLTCNVAPLAAEDSVSMSIIVTPEAVADSVELTNTAAVTAVEVDPNTANNTATLTTTVNPPASDIMISVSATPSSPAIGEQVTFAIVVTNDGPSDTDGVVVDLTAPAAGIDPSITTDTGSCKAISAGITCSLGSMASGASATITVVVTAPQQAVDLPLSASATAVNDDPTPANNTASGTVSVIDAVDLVIRGVGGGSGSFGLVGLLGLLVAVLLTLAPVSEGYAQQDWYVGAAFGESDANYSAADLTGDLASRGWTITDASTNDTDTAWKVYGGLEVTDYFAVELGFVELGEVGTRYSASIPPNDIDSLLGDTFEVHPYLGKGWVAAGVFNWPFSNDQFAFLAKAGVFAWEADIDVWVDSGGTGSVSGDDSGTDMMYGIGVEWRLDPNWSITAEWERYRLNDWVDVPMIGLKWSF